MPSPEAMVMPRDIFADAHGKWPNILPMFGVSSNYLTGRNTPCPLCGGKDRFRFLDTQGRGTWICNQCGAGNGMTMIMSMTGKQFREAADEVRSICGTVPETKPRPRMHPDKARSLCIELWRESKPIRDGDDAMEYLLSRGLEPPYGQQLRFHPKVPVKNHPTKTRLPAMLARVSDNAGHGVNIHRTYLTDGQKADYCYSDTGEQAPAKKMMPGAIPQDAAIRLFPHEGILGVAEGIETALAVHRDTGIPCWSLINSTHMAKWVWPKGIKELHIFADADKKFGGQAAAFALAHRVAVSKDAPTILVRVPDELGTDFAD